MTEFPKLLPTAEVTSLSGQQRQPYADKGPTGPTKEAAEDKLEQKPDESTDKSATPPRPRTVTLRVPDENLVQRAKVWFGFGRRM